MPDPTGIAVPFTEAIDFLKAKLGRNLPSKTWSDTYGRVNSVGFAVAGAWKDALLTDLGAAVQDHLTNGKTVAEFQKVFEAIAAKHQWAYKGKPAWRAAIILNTNLRSAYAAGKWQQIQRLKASRPYIRYVAVMDARTRPLHKEWNGTILGVDDTWWKTHFPPNGWNCRCTVMNLSERDLARKDWKVSDASPGVGLVPTEVDPRRGVAIKAVPVGIDPGFEHNAGAVLEAPFVPQLADDLADGFVAPIARRDASVELAARPTFTGNMPTPPDLPPPRVVDASTVLPDGTSDQDAIAAFLNKFGVRAGETALIDDYAGGRIGISDRMFQEAGGQAKIGKGNRRPYMGLLADVVLNPDEVWVSLEQTRDGRLVVRKRAFGRFVVDGKKLAGFAAFEWDSNGVWEGRTVFAPQANRANPDVDRYLAERSQYGVRLYARGGE